MSSVPLIFLPGFMCDARLFWHQILEFSATRTVIAVPLSGATIEDMAEAVIAVAPPRFALVGHWLGGLVAMEVLRRVPERVSEMALIDVSHLPETPKAAAERETRIVRVRSGRLDEVMLEEIPAQSLAPGEGRAEVQAMLLDMAGTLGPEVFTAQSRALMRRPDQQRALRLSRVRALMICGEHDTLCPPRRHEFLAELMPQGSFRQIPGAGHLSPLEAPQEVTAVLRAWLEGAPET